VLLAAGRQPICAYGMKWRFRLAGGLFFAQAAGGGLTILFFAPVLVFALCNMAFYARVPLNF
jgi:uncharacterized membrane protein